MAKMMNMDAEALALLEATVQQAEKTTAGEIVVVIAPRSHGWSGARTAFALPFAALAGLLLSRFVDAHAGWMALIGMPTLFCVGWLLAGIPALARMIVGEAALDAAVLQAAKVAFVDHGVHATKTRAGVLVYLSLFERRVQVLGDAAVHAVIGDAGWQSYANRIGGAMRTRDVNELIAIVRDVGTTLARSFPRGADDVNELADAVRT